LIRNGENPPGSRVVVWERLPQCKKEKGDMKKLFVGSLSWDTDDDALRKAFEEFGEVTEAKVITDRDSGRSRGFGFVSFVNDQEADKAIQQMDGADLDGRTLNVNVAKERAPRNNNYGGGGSGGGFRDGGGGGGYKSQGGGRDRW